MRVVGIATEVMTVEPVGGGTATKDRRVPMEQRTMVFLSEDMVGACVPGILAPG